MKIGFTGSRKGMTPEQKESIRMVLRHARRNIVEIHHGDCRGADEEFHELCRILTTGKIIGHPPENSALRAWCLCDESREPLPYLARNRKVVEACDVLIAAPETFEEMQRSGTWATVRYARKREGVLLLTVFPDGRCVMLGFTSPKVGPKDGR